MRERDFAGARDSAAADETGVADRVVRRAKRALADKPCAPGQPRDRVNLGQFQRGFKFERRQNGRQPLGEHRLA
jgi:hypothetical protein